MRVSPVRIEASFLAEKLTFSLKNSAERQRAEQPALDTVANAESIIETVRERLVILRQDLRVRTASRVF